MAAERDYAWSRLGWKKIWSSFSRKLFQTTLIITCYEKIIHGDLKGVNILMRPSGRPCIADFGLARVADSKVRKMSSSTDAHHLGTIRWLAPELLRDDGRTTKSSDMYAFGCVCYEVSI
ncbi:hypothetical protein MPER_00976 [Moniliophthora perniciosa FA553]|nr:hypothetical protein MPER_00976 [Moniliophthora perniciosa FA553]